MLVVSVWYKTIRSRVYQLSNCIFTFSCFLIICYPHITSSIKELPLCSKNHYIVNTHDWKIDNPPKKTFIFRSLNFASGVYPLSLFLLQLKLDFLWVFLGPIEIFFGVMIIIKFVNLYISLFQFGPIWSHFLVFLVKVGLL